MESSFLTSDLSLALAVSLLVKGTLKDSDDQRSGPIVLSHFFSVSFCASLVLEAPLCFHFSNLFFHFHFCESFLKGFSLNFFIDIY